MIGGYSGSGTRISNVESISCMNQTGWAIVEVAQGKSRRVGPNRKELGFLGVHLIEKQEATMNTKFPTRTQL